jgi:hypothetical protein
MALEQKVKDLQQAVENLTAVVTDLRQQVAELQSRYLELFAYTALVGVMVVFEPERAQVHEETNPPITQPIARRRQ